MRRFLGNGPFVVLMLLILSMGLFVFPGFSAEIDHFTKALIFIFLTAIIFLWHYWKELHRGVISIKWHPVLGTLLALLVIALLSSLLSESTLISMIGSFYESESFVILFFLSLLVFLLLSLLGGVKKIHVVFSLLSFLGTALLVFETVRLVFGESGK